MREYMIYKLVNLLMKLYFVLFQHPKSALPMKVLTTLIKVEFFLEKFSSPQNRIIVSMTKTMAEM